MGVVYAAHDRERNTRVALKTLRKMAGDTLLRFKNEFRALQDLQHPNLVSLGELIEVDGQWLLTMELVDGVNFLTYVRSVPREGGRTHLSSAIAWGSSTQPDQGLGDATLDDHATHLDAPTGSMGSWPVDEAHIGAERFDEQRLRSGLAQLARGIFALHRAQKVHRDIKPSNILVTREGRVVLLDFGLVAELEERWIESRVVGTFAYMAPEQAMVKPVGPAADWYSMGVVLYETLTGRIPFVGEPAVLLRSKQLLAPAPPRALCPEVPDDLDALCVELLAIDPRDRPHGPEILRRLNVEADVDRARLVPVAALSESFSGPHHLFVGRHSELHALEQAATDARRGAPVVACVQGESGVGKSALVRHFLDQLLVNVPGMVALEGRCYERESVPYKAFDRVVDGLSRFLARLPEAELAPLLPPHVALLAQVFPVLGSVGLIGKAPRTDAEVRDPQELRQRVFVALRELLVRLAAARPLVLSIDDMQWTDADSLALLAEVLRPPDAPALLLLATVRSETSVGGVSAAMRLFGGLKADLRTVQLSGLPQEEAEELASLLLQNVSGGAQISSTAIAHEAGGHPLFIDELIRHSREGQPRRLRLEEALWTRICELEPRVRQLLELVAIASGPLRQEVAARAAAADPPELMRLISLLRVAQLVRTSGMRAGSRIEPYHDRVRESVVANLDPPTRQSWHGRLALALEADAQRDAETLAFHWREAGDGPRAADYAVVAAKQATEALAFDRAAHLYRQALELKPHTEEVARELRLLMAHALSSAGRGPEAAEAYLAGAEGTAEDDAMDLHRRAAEQYLRSGHIDEGLAVLQAVLAREGLKLPQSPRGALASLVMRRAQLRLRGLSFVARPAGELSKHDLSRIDTCWAVSAGLSMVDTVRGADFQTRSLLMSLEQGEPFRVSRALFLEACFVAAVGGPVAKRSASLLRTASEISATQTDPYLDAMVTGCAGVVAFLEGRWRAAHTGAQEAELMLRERCTDVAWEHANLTLYSLWSLFFLGEIGEMARRIPRQRQAALHRGDLYLATNLSTGILNLYNLVHDDVATARRQTAETFGQWSRRGFHVQHFLELYSQARVDFYAGEGQGAYARVQQHWSAAASSQLLRAQFVRVIMHELRACAALFLARDAGDKGEKLLAAAERDIKRIAKEKMPWTDPVASLLSGCAEALRGHTESAVAQFQTSIEQAEAADMRFYAMAARHRLGQVVRGDEGRALCGGAEEWLAAQKVQQPRRWFALLTPDLDE